MGVRKKGRVARPSKRIGYWSKLFGQPSSRKADTLASASVSSFALKFGYSLTDCRIECADDLGGEDTGILWRR